MRAWATLPLIVLLALPAAAQTALLDDPSGDVVWAVDATGTADPLGSGHLDLLSLAAEEQSDVIVLHLTVADLTGGGTSQYMGGFYAVRFTAQDVDYRTVAFTEGGTEASAYLQRHDPSIDNWATTTRLYATVDPGTNTISIPIPREHIQDSFGATPQPGWVLDGFQADAANIDFEGCCSFGPLGEVPAPPARHGDLMPDEGFGTGLLPITLGLRQTGHAFLDSDAPTRASNGEATTIVFEVTGWNRGTGDDRFDIEVSGTPSAWQVQVPTPLVEIPAGQNVSIPVIVTTPFGHKHGALESFQVSMQSHADPSAVGRIELGIRYMAIPQPAGHHDTLYFHTVAQETNPFEDLFMLVSGQDWSVYGYMNAAESDDVATGEPLPARRGGINVRGDNGPSESGPRQMYRWFLPLAPGLQMGLDFDLTRTGTIRVPVTTDLPMLQAGLEGTLFHVSGPEDAFGRRQDTVVTALADIVGTAPRDVQGGSTVFESIVVPREEADMVPFQKDAGLFLELEINFTRIDPFLGPAIGPRLTGGDMTLPLFEYRDPVDQLYSSVRGVVIHAETPQERLVNPGDVAVYRFMMMDHGQGQGTFDLSLTGPNAAWAQVVGDTTIQVAKGGSRAVVVAVAVPGDARDGEVADLVLQVTHREDPSVRSIARVFAEVDQDTDHADEADSVPGLRDQLTSAKDAPLLPVLAVLAAVGLAALRRRH